MLSIWWVHCQWSKQMSLSDPSKCKHLLAVFLSRRLGRCIERPINPNDLVHVVKGSSWRLELNSDVNCGLYLYRDSAIKWNRHGFKRSSFKTQVHQTWQWQSAERQAGARAEFICRIGDWSCDTNEVTPKVSPPGASSGSLQYLLDTMRPTIGKLNWTPNSIAYWFQ